jgi:hypothetical protein
MATPAIFNINYYRGDTYKFTIKPLDQEGNAVTLDSGPNAVFTVATSRGSTPTASHLCSATVVENTIECEITPAQGDFTGGVTSYVYDVEYTATSGPGAGEVQTFLTGNLTVTEDVSNA